MKQNIRSINCRCLMCRPLRPHIQENQLYLQTLFAVAEVWVRLYHELLQPNYQMQRIGVQGLSVDHQSRNLSW